MPTISEDARRVATQQRDEIQNPPAPAPGQPRVADPRRYSISAEMLRQPSGRYEVMIDSWGSEPHVAGSRFVKGDIVAPEDAPQYDFEWAERQGVIRELNLAEARTLAPSTTQSLTADGAAVDADLAEAGPIHAGILSPEATGVLSDPDWQPVTVTGPQGPREDPEFAKPTLPGPRDNSPAGRPVIEAPEGAETGAHAQIVREYFASRAEEDEPAARPAGRASGGRLTAAEKKERERARVRARRARAKARAAEQKAADEPPANQPPPGETPPQA